MMRDKKLELNVTLYNSSKTYTTEAIFSDKLTKSAKKVFNVHQSTSTIAKSFNSVLNLIWKDSGSNIK